jgi:hypothetical protein
MHHHSAEPKLEEALSEDLVQAIMRADHVHPMWLRALLGSIARTPGLHRPTITGRSCCRFQGGTLGAWLPWRRRHPRWQADRLGCQETRK